MKIFGADRGIFTFFTNSATAKNLGVVPLHSHLLKQAPKHYLTNLHTTPTLLPPRSTQSFGTPLHLSYKTHYKTYNNLLIIYPKILVQISFKFMIVYIYFSLKNIINYITFPKHHTPLIITCQTTNSLTQFQYNFNKKFIKNQIKNQIQNPFQISLKTIHNPSWPHPRTTLFPKAFSRRYPKTLLKRNIFILKLILKHPLNSKNLIARILLTTRTKVTIKHSLTIRRFSNQGNFQKNCNSKSKIISNIFNNRYTVPLSTGKPINCLTVPLSSTKLI